MKYFAPIMFVLMVGVFATTTTAIAQPFRARQGVQSGEVRSLDEILSGIRRARPGNLADVQGPNMDITGEPHYRLKWLTPDGRVLWLDTDARSGRVLGVEGDDAGPIGRQGFQGGPQGRGNFPPDNPGAQQSGPPPGFFRGAPRGRFNQGPPPGYQGPPPGYDQGPPPGYGPPDPRFYNRGDGDRRPRGRFRDGR